MFKAIEDSNQQSIDQELCQCPRCPSVLKQYIVLEDKIDGFISSIPFYLTAAKPPYVVIPSTYGGIRLYSLFYTGLYVPVNTPFLLKRGYGGAREVTDRSEPRAIKEVWFLSLEGFMTFGHESGRHICNFFIRFRSVLGLRPSRDAAPVRPSTFHADFSSV